MGYDVPPGPMDCPPAEKRATAPVTVTGSEKRTMKSCALPVTLLPGGGEIDSTVGGAVSGEAAVSNLTVALTRSPARLRTGSAAETAADAGKWLGENSTCGPWYKTLN